MALMPKRVKYRKQQRGRIHATRRGAIMWPSANMDCRPSNKHGSRVGRSRPVASRPRTFCIAKVKCIFGFSPTIHTRPNRWKPVWVKAGRNRRLGGPGQARNGHVRNRRRAGRCAKLALSRVAHKMPVKCRLVARRHSLA